VFSFPHETMAREKIQSGSQKHLVSSIDRRGLCLVISVLELAVLVSVADSFSLEGSARIILRLLCAEKRKRIFRRQKDDPESGLQYNLARSYSPAIAR
jgi:hypothetical protein